MKTNHFTLTILWPAAARTDFGSWFPSPVWGFWGDYWAQCL